MGITRRIPEVSDAVLRAGHRVAGRDVAAAALRHQGRPRGRRVAGRARVRAVVATAGDELLFAGEVAPERVDAVRALAAERVAEVVVRVVAAGAGVGAGALLGRRDGR